jgi:hypothetical protein
MDCNSIRNEQRILHDGSAQSGRAPFALSPDYVRVDERGYADWLVFVRDYARFLQYYDQNNTASGDWTPFWSTNPAIVLSALAAARVDWFREETRLIFTEIQKLDNQINLPLLQQNFNRLFDSVATLAKVLDEHLKRLPDDLNIRFSLQNLIQGTLAPAFKNWIAWHKKAKSVGAPYPLLAAGDSFLTDRVKNMRIVGEAPIDMGVVLTHAFSADWITDASADWTTYVNGIAADDVVFGTAPVITTTAGHINFAVRHFFFTNAFETFLKGYAKVVQESGVALLDLLQNWNRHEPHLALYLSFLRLLGYERDYLNGLTERHLRFYYERVLHLAPKGAAPSHGHVVIELAKHVNAHLLQKNTPFKAGKDSTGKEIVFTLDQDFVANKAQVTDLKSLFKAPNDTQLYKFNPDLPAYKNTDARRYFAASVTNSQDGLGAELLNANKQWEVFGNKALTADKQFWNVTMPLAEVGFAFASHYLFLKDGTRTITLTFNGVMNGVLHGKTFKLYLTTEKNWYETQATVSGNQLVIQLDGSAPAITPYITKTHGGSFDTKLPMLKAVLLNQTGALYAYEDLKNMKLSSVGLRVDVVGKKTMALSGPTGPLDASKPFYPFGAAPESKAVFHIGDKEVFQKASNITLKFTWKEPYAPIGESGGYFHEHTSDGHPETQFHRLRNGQWISSSAGEMLALTSISPSVSFNLTSNDRIIPDFTPNQFFSLNAVAGFVQFTLIGDWGHSIYPKALAAFIANGGSDPSRPYNPQIISASLDYNASTTIPLVSQSGYLAQRSRFFHLHPFGFEAITPDNNPTRLLPLMVPQSDDGVVNNIGKDGGEWYIGVKDLVPPQVLSLLIQVADGSADPLIEKPENHVQWAYLVGNEWVNFKSEEVSDSTNALLQSGLVQLSVPREANTVHSILPEGLHWIRVSVQTAVDAVCQLIGVHAQGAAVTLSDNQNDPQLSALPLPTGTIAKLVESNGAVKKVWQPYATFGGRAAETGPHFFTRVSERLRHKNRAIALWDYERMVLEAFPSVHKVKCLNHLRFEPVGNSHIYRELAPGHVTLIVIPSLHNRNAVNPLRPYTSLGELKNIDAFLKSHTSCLVRLHVRNPLFEPIRAEFKVRLYAGYDEAFYTQLLNDEIIRFLSPWAFGTGEDIGFGGKIYKSALINHVEEQPYVDYVEDFKLIHQTIPPKPDQEAIEPSTLCSILVSAEKHLITVIEKDVDNVAAEDCGCGQSLATRPQRRQDISTLQNIRNSNG